MPLHLACPLPVTCRCARPVATAVVALLLLGTSAALAQVTSESLGFVGPVASVQEYQEYPGSIERQLVREWTFTEDGIASEGVYLSYSFMDGTLRSRRVTHYDPSGLPLVTQTLGPDEAPMGRVAYRYDGEGRMIEQATYDADGLETRKLAYERDGDGRVVAQETYTAGTLFRRVERSLDAQGRTLEEHRFDGGGNLIEVRTYTEPDLVYESVQYDEAGEVEATGRVEEGEHGVVSWTSYRPDGELAYEYTFRYDPKGRELERREVRDGEVTVYATSYQEDEAGNWVLRERTEDMGSGPMPYEVVDRQITYR